MESRNFSVMDSDSNIFVMAVLDKYKTHRENAI